MDNIRLTIWNEYLHEKTEPAVATIYPDGIHRALADGMSEYSGIEVRTATLEEPEHGLNDDVLRDTDVLTWWGHGAHDEVEDVVVDRIQSRVLEGMGLIVLHSGHYSKIFRRLMGTTCNLTWREAGERERVWVANPGHPIARGIDHCIELENSEMYGEPFGIPEPEEQVFISWFEGGEVFRSGCCWHRGAGRIFYFSPGHELYPIYYDPQIRRVLANSVYWAKPRGTWINNLENHVPIESAREAIVPRGPQMHDESGALHR